VLFAISSGLAPRVPLYVHADDMRVIYAFLITRGRLYGKTLATRVSKLDREIKLTKIFIVLSRACDTGTKVSGFRDGRETPRRIQYTR